MALIGRRVRVLLDYVRDLGSTHTHFDAKSRSARDFPVPRSNLRRPAPPASHCKKLSTFEPTRHRNRSEALGTGVRPYETTCLPAWQPDRTNWCHGSPAQHAWSLLQAGQPPSRPDSPGRPNRQPSPLTATCLIYAPSVPGSHRAGPGDLGGALYGRTDYGRPRRSDGRSPGKGKG